MAEPGHRDQVCPHIAYMPQGLGTNLYPTVSVEENLQFFGRLFGHDAGERRCRIDDLTRSTGLTPFLSPPAGKLSCGMKQKQGLCCALIHDPEQLILDEPTSGVDPIARDGLWQLMIDLARNDHVTIFISTHFMNEAGRCDRIALMHAGRVLVTEAPAELIRQRGTTTLEQAFIGYLQEADPPGAVVPEAPAAASAERARSRPLFSLARAWSYSLRETLELTRDPVRATMALLGTAIRMFVVGYGISLDVEHLTFAVLDRDQTMLSRDYALNLSGSRYFVEQPAIADMAR